MFKRKHIVSGNVHRETKIGNTTISIDCEFSCDIDEFTKTMIDVEQVVEAAYIRMLATLRTKRDEAI